MVYFDLTMWISSKQVFHRNNIGPKGYKLTSHIDGYIFIFFGQVMSIK